MALLLCLRADFINGPSYIEFFYNNYLTQYYDKFNIEPISYTEFNKIITKTKYPDWTDFLTDKEFLKSVADISIKEYIKLVNPQNLIPVIN